MSLVRPQRKVFAVVMLFFVAPLVAEFLLGNLSLKLLPALIVLVPMYGGGAVVIRETARRAGRGWPSMLLLGAAYALIEESFATQSLFNPDYLRMHMHLLDHAYLPALGMGAWWTVFLLNLHAFWSMGVSIALVEAVVPAQATTPWMGWMGDGVAAVLFVFGLVANARFTIKQDPFVASHAQLLGAALICGVLIGCAFLLPVRAWRRGEGAVPNAWVTGGVAWVLGIGVLITPPMWGWGAVGALLVLDGIFLGTVVVFSRRGGWSSLNTLSLAAGGALAYGLHAFVETPVAGGTGALARVGNAIFLAGAVGLIVAGVRRASRLTVWGDAANLGG